MLDRAGRTVVRSFIDRANEDFIGAMSIPVAWLIEDSLRTPGVGVIRASIREVSGSGEKYTVTFTIDNRDVSSVWIREYGSWRIQSFGTAVTGDMERVRQRETRDRRTAPRLRTAAHRFFVEIGYANLFDKAPAALYASFGIAWGGVQVYYAGPDFWTLGMYAGFQRAFTVRNFGIMPHLRVGLSYQHDQDFRDWYDAHDRWETSLADMPTAFPFFFMTQAGFRITSSYVPGLFLGFNFQLNFLNFHSALNNNWDNTMRRAFVISAGYIF